MPYPIANLKDKSFSWGFLLVAALLLVPSIWGRDLGLTKTTTGVLLGVAGSIPFLIQAATGYGLDASWTTRFSRVEKPFQYWTTILLSAVFAIVFWVTAYTKYLGHNAA